MSDLTFFDIVRYHNKYGKISTICPSQVLNLFQEKLEHDKIAIIKKRNRFELIWKTFRYFKIDDASKKGERKIRRITARNMLDLNHYKFKLKLKLYAEKYGKHVVDVNESYTSKTKSWNGEIDNKLGSKKIIKGNNFSVDRDINGARGIFLKNLTRGA
ncbi:Putative transposase DNA-binding domain protein [Thiovulum sp. ES]|nr:Putative transposase DNA-binding domain protein [Thiovulum sp. ES]